MIRFACLTLVVLGLRAGAQEFGFSASATPNPVTVSNSLTYSFNITNTSGFVITNAFLTNQLSYPNLGTNPSGWITVGTNTTVFQTGPMLVGYITNFGWSASPTLTGVFTDRVFYTNTATLIGPSGVGLATNLVAEVTLPNCDLQVTMSAPGGVVVNDSIVLDVAITNLGSNTAPNVVLTNILPASFKLLGLTPTNLVATITNGLFGKYVVINYGALTNRGSAVLHLNVQPTNSGVFELGAYLVASPVLDTNLANNVAILTNFYVSPTLSGELEVSLVSTQRFNPQTALMEQTIRVSNTGATDVVSARVLVPGLTNWLFNASGTNGNSPFIVYGGPLATGESVTMLLKFFVTNRQAVTNFTLSAVEVPLFIPPVPSGSPVTVTKIINYAPGQPLIEFPSTNGQSYTLVYSDNPGFLNPRPSQPAIVGRANRVQWIDDGPPATATAVSNVTARFYRVIANH